MAISCHYFRGNVVGVENLAFQSTEIEPGPLTLFLLEPEDILTLPFEIMRADLSYGDRSADDNRRHGIGVATVRCQARINAYLPTGFTKGGKL